jgi:hypothetical protein
MLRSCQYRDIWEVPTKPGLNCVSPQQEQNNLIAHQAIGIFVDFALFALPIWVINAKMIFSTKKIQVILVFSVGIFVVATGIVRMVMLNTLLFLEDPYVPPQACLPYGFISRGTNHAIAIGHSLCPQLAHGLISKAMLAYGVRLSQPCSLWFDWCLSSSASVAKSSATVAPTKVTTFRGTQTGLVETVTGPPVLHATRAGMHGTAVA